MSGYVKKVLVFDEVGEGFATNGKKVSGVIKAEKSVKKSNASVYITNFNRNLADSLECVLVIGKKTYQAKSQSCQFEVNIDDVGQHDDISCLVAAVQEGACLPVAFATNNNCIRAEHLSKHLTNFEQVTKYERFICAADNYFESDDSFDLDAIRKKSISKFRPIEMLASLRQTKEKTFFANAKDTLIKIFESYPPCDELNENMPNSFWIQVPFKNKKFFSVGLLQQEGKPRYIAYGVPGKLTKPPEDDSFAFFATKNKEVGFWIICQDATTGLAASQPYFWV